MRYKLVFISGPEKMEIPVPLDRFTIGRSASCNLRPKDDAVSRRHCEITQDDHTVQVRDLGSTNGTYVNDLMIGQETELVDGDRLRVGTLVFEVQIDLDDSDSPTLETVDLDVSRAGGLDTSEMKALKNVVGEKQTRPYKEIEDAGPRDNTAKDR